MSKRSIVAGWLVLCLTLSAQGSQAKLSLTIDQVLADVSRNIKEFQDLLPDFECSERITSSAYEGNNLLTVQRVVDSVFTGRQKEDGAGHAYTESRELKTIDGSSAVKGQSMPSLPLQYGGGFSASVVSVFAPEAHNYRTYRLAGTSNIGSTSALIVEFATKARQQKLQMFSMGKQFVVRDKGKAWVDPASMQVLRLDREFTDFPNFNAFSTTVDYGESEIGNRKFWMPATVRAEATDTLNHKVSYVAKYSQCHRFATTIELNFAE